MKYEDLNPSPGRKLGRIVGGVKSQAEAAHTRPSGSIHIPAGSDLTFDMAERTRSVKVMDAELAEYNARMEKAAADLVEAEERLAQLATDLQAARDNVSTALSDAAAARAAAEAATGQASDAALAAQDAWNKAVTEAAAAKTGAITEAQRLADQAEADAIAAAATDATTKADAARDAAIQAAKDLDVPILEKATAAFTSANGRNSRIISTDPATGTKNPTTGLALVKGDTWWQWNNLTEQVVVGAWAWDGTLWRPEKISDAVIASLDVNKLVVTGSARIAQAVVEKLIADAAHFGALTTDKLSAGEGEINSLVAQQIAGAVAAFQKVFADQLVSRGATIDSAVIRDLAVQLITSKLFRTAGEGQRWELDTDGLRAYDANGNLTVHIDGVQNWLSATLKIGADADGLGYPGVSVGTTGYWWGDGTPVYGMRFFDADNSNPGAQVYTDNGGGITIQSGQIETGRNIFYRIECHPSHIRLSGGNTALGVNGIVFTQDQISLGSGAGKGISIKDGWNTILRGPIVMGQSQSIASDENGIDWDPDASVWIGGFDLVSPGQPDWTHFNDIPPGWRTVKAGIPGAPVAGEGFLDGHAYGDRTGYYSTSGPFRQTFFPTSGDGVWTRVRSASGTWRAWTNLVPTNIAGTVTWVNGATCVESRVRRITGSVVMALGNITKGAAEIVGYLPTGFAPPINVWVPAWNETGNASTKAWIEAGNGAIHIPSVAQGTRVSITASLTL